MSLIVDPSSDVTLHRAMDESMSEASDESMSEASDESMSEASDEYCSTDESDCAIRISEKNIWNSAHILTRRAAFYSKIDEYFKAGTYTDVNIICQNRVFRCHRLALAAASEYFHHMFRGNFAESHRESVFLQDIDSVTFDRILHYVYTGKLVAIDDDNVYSLLRASEILRLDTIEDSCIHYLTQKNIPTNYALQIHLFACTMCIFSLIPVTSRFILKNLDRFVQETEFLRMPFEDFSALLTYFQAASLSQETKLLSTILQYVRHSSDDVYKDERTCYMELVRKVRFKFLSIPCISEYFDRKWSDSNGEGGRGETFAWDEEIDSNIMENEKISIHVYIGTDVHEPLSHVNVSRTPKQTSVFTLQETSTKDIDWRLSLSGKPFIQKMRIVESEGRKYFLKLSQQRWTFGTCSNNTHQFLIPPSGLFLMTPRVDCENFYSAKTFSLCSLDEDIYLCGLHRSVGFQRYRTEVDEWSPIPMLSEKCEPSIVMNDDTRLYMIGEKKYSDGMFFAAYDPRVGKLDYLDSGGLSGGYRCTEPGSYHKGRLYLPTSGRSEEFVSSTFRMAIYDPSAGRWDVQNLKSHCVSYTSHRRLVSFKDRLWMFGFEDCYLYTQTYDSYLQKWDTSYHAKLADAIVRSGLDYRCFTDVIVSD